MSENPEQVKIMAEQAPLALAEPTVEAVEPSSQPQTQIAVESTTQLGNGVSTDVEASAPPPALGNDADPSAASPPAKKKAKAREFVDDWDVDKPLLGTRNN